MSTGEWPNWEIPAEETTTGKNTDHLGFDAVASRGGTGAGARPTELLDGQQQRIAHLIVKRGAPQGRAFQLGLSASLGRDSRQNDVVLRGDDTVSRQHAQVRFEDGSFVFYNLSGSYGSYLISRLGRQRIDGRLVLCDGDEIEIGERTLLAFRQSS